MNGRGLSDRMGFLAPALFVLLSCVPRACAQPPASPCAADPAEKKLLLTPFVEYYSDTSARIPPGRINLPGFAARFAHANGAMIHFPLSGSAHWLRFALVNPLPDTVEKWIVVDWRFLDTLETYLETNGALQSIQITGQRIPFVQRPQKFRNYCVPVKIAPHSNLVVYLRVRSTEALSLTLYLWQPEAFRVNDQNTFFLFGAFYGLAIAVLLVTLVIYLFSHDRIYLYYSLMLIFLHILFTMSRQGLTQMFLLQQLPNIAVPAHLGFVSLGQVFALLLARSFLRYTFKTAWGAWVYYSQVAVLICAAVLPFFAGYTAGTIIVTNISCVSFILVLTINIFSLHKKNRPTVYFLFAWIFHIIGGITVVATQWGVLSSPVIADYGYEAGLCLELILISLAIAYGFVIDQKQKETVQKDLLAAQQAALFNLKTRMNSKIQELQTKIAPHFLFNALNSISALAASNAGEAEKAIAMLSSFYRLSQSFSQRKMVRLSEEMELADTYARLQKIRFRDRIEYHSVLPEDLGDFQVPAFIIQPLVENAIKHGLSGKTEGGRIDVTAGSAQGATVITIKDNGVGWNASQTSSGHGLENIMERLDLVYGDKHEFSIASDNGVTVRIQLPTRRNNGIPGDDY